MLDFIRNKNKKALPIVLFLLFIALLITPVITILIHRFTGTDNVSTVNNEIPEGYTTFTDANLYNCVANTYSASHPSEDISAGLTDEQLASMTGLNCGKMGITDTTGLEKMTGLTSLNLSSNQLTSIDVSNNTALTSLGVTYNQLTSLDVSSNTNLQILFVGFNQLTSLDVSNNTALTNLYVRSNQLTSLDVSHNTNLYYLYVDNIPVKTNLTLSQASDGIFTADLSGLDFIYSISDTDDYAYDSTNHILTINNISNIGGYVVASDSNGEPFKLQIPNPLTFDMNGGSGNVSMQTCYPDTLGGSCDVTIPDTTPTREGYTFLGYSTSSSSAAADYSPNSTISISGYTPLYAVWADSSSIIVNYTVNDNIMGSVSPVAEFIASTTESASGSTATASVGYHFVNWTNESGDVVSDSATFIPEKVGETYESATYTANFAKTIPIYEVTEGDGQTVIQGESISFRTNASFSSFNGEVYVDNIKLNESAYTANSDGTIFIILSEAFSSSLSLGEHNIIIVFSDDGIAMASFSVEEKVTPTPTPTPDPDVPNTGANQDATKNSTSTDPTASTVPNMTIVLAVALVAASTAYIVVKKGWKI